MSPSHIDIVQFNCNGIRAQHHHIVQLIKKYSPNFVLLQELKISSRDIIKFKGYKLITNLSANDTHLNSSVGILIRNGILFNIIDIPNDLCVVGINTFNGVPASIFSYYDNRNLKKLSESNLKRIIGLGKHKPIMMGDFNTRSYLWDNNKKLMFNDSRAKAILNFIENSEVILLNDGSITRISPIYNNHNSAIDLTFVHNDFSSKFSWSVSNSSFGSDHLPTLLTFNYENISRHKRIIYDLKTTDWDLFNENCKFNKILNAENIEEMEIIIEGQIKSGLMVSTKYFEFPNNKKRTVPWWDEELDFMKKTKNKMLAKYIKCQSKENLTSLKKISAQYKRKLKKNKIDSWEEFVDEINGEMEIKELWNRIKKVDNKDYSKNIKHILDDKDMIVEDPSKIVKELGIHYQSVSNQNSLSTTEMIKFNDLKSKIKASFINKFPTNDEDFTMEELLRSIQNTHDSAPGQDGFKYKIFKKLDLSNLYWLLKFYNEIWRLGHRPSCWNHSLVIPIKKCADAKYVHQTRPINLINTKTKLFDKMVNSRLIYILEKGSFLDNNQFGFRQNKQCLKSLMSLNNNIIKALQNKSHLHMISFDIKKAFDAVWPDSILLKLQNIGIGGCMFNYIINFLKPRQFKVSNNSINSDVFTTDIGVPQGSPLSSTLFLISFQHILDELRLIHYDIEISAYADDLFIYLDNLSNMETQRRLQDAVDTIVYSGEKVGLNLSLEKSKAIHFCRKRKCVPPINKIHDNVIERVNSLKLLGIIFQKNYLFNLHINYLKLRLDKDIQVIKVLSSSKYGVNQNILKKIITALSISKINYCIEIYGHTNLSNIKFIDSKLNKLKRIMLNAFVSTPRTSLSILSGIGTFNDLLIKANLISGVKFKSVNKDDYIQINSKNRHIEMVNQHLNRMSLDCTDIIQNNSIISPSNSILNQVHINIFKLKKEELNISIVKPTLREFLSNKNVVCELYTDGSKGDDGCSYAVTTKSDILLTNKIHPNSSVFSAEGFAMLCAIKKIKTSNLIGKHAILTDSMSVLEELCSLKLKKSELVCKIKNELQSCTNLIIIWIPSHFGISGNELADETAKMINSETYNFKNRASVPDLIQHIKYCNQKTLQDNWNQEIENKLYDVRPNSTYFPMFEDVSKYEAMVINRVRAGHSFLTHSYLLSKELPPICRYCKIILTIKHIFECSTTKSINNRNKFDIDDWKKHLYDSTKIKNILDFLKFEKYYNLI